MKMIQTVLGKIAPETLGFCHSHEHIMLARGVPYTIDSALCADDYDKSLQELELLKSVGGRALVDAQPIGAGRMSVEMARLSAESGVHIVASTGFHRADFYPAGHWVFTWDEARITELFVHEITVGMFTQTENAPPRDFHEAKAGQLKVAYTTDGLNTYFTRLFSAAAAACISTGAPMMIHIDNGMNPLVLDEFLHRRGVSPEKRIYCHLDRAVADIGIHLELCKRGCWLEYDTIGRPKYHDDAVEIAIIQQVMDAGYVDNILLGLDTTNKRLKAYGGDIGLDYISRTFIPSMMTAGISCDAIDAFMLSNPARAFAF